jgi:poly(3-hydroxybutyrate) depolymerase
MAEGPLDGRTDALALEARAAAGVNARVPALIIHGSADDAVAPGNSTHLVRQFLLFNGGELPPGAALPPTLTRAVQPRGFGYIMSEYYAGRRLAARHLTIPGLGHAWSGGDSALEYFDDRYPDATTLVCDFFDGHRRRA